MLSRSSQLAIALFLAGVLNEAATQELEFPISPNRVGSGARAAGMADAFVAIADDATAASWNPAGLVQLERPEIAIVGEFTAIREQFQSSNNPEFDSTQRDRNVDLNFASVTWPLPWLLRGRNMTLSLALQKQYDIGRQFDTVFTSESGGVSTDRLTTFEQEGALTTISPGFGIELTEKLSIGVAVNIWRDNFLTENEWEQNFQQEQVTTLPGGGTVSSVRSTRTHSQNVQGTNVTAGLLWEITPKWKLGLRYDSPLRADLDFSSIDTLNGTITRIDEDRELRVPGQFAVGLAYRPNDRFTVSFDTSYTQWDDFAIENAAGERFSLVDAFSLDDPAVATNFDPTVTVRLGFEYVFIPKEPAEDLKRLWTLRWGVFYDPEPASGRSESDTTAPGDGEPDKFYGGSIGLGLLIRNRVNLDFAYQIRHGNDVNADFFRGIPGFSEDVLQHRLLFSTVIYF